MILPFCTAFLVRIPEQFVKLQLLSQLLCTSEYWERRRCALCAAHPQQASGRNCGIVSLNQGQGRETF